jgi:hypothetical protein
MQVDDDSPSPDAAADRLREECPEGRREVTVLTSSSQRSGEEVLVGIIGPVIRKMERQRTINHVTRRHVVDES